MAVISNRGSLVSLPLTPGIAGLALTAVSGLRRPWLTVLLLILDLPSHFHSLFRELRGQAIMIDVNLGAEPHFCHGHAKVVMMRLYT